MSREMRCMAEIGDWLGHGRLLLDADALAFRGAVQLTIPRDTIKAAHDENGWLVIEYVGGSARFDLGALTPAWVNAILHPR